MPAASWVSPADDRLLHIDAATGAVGHHRPDDLPDLLAPGDLLVLNDAATLPASLSATAHGRRLELRLAEWRREGPLWAVLMGEGSWREDTDLRPAPPTLHVGERLTLAGGIAARVVAVDPRSPRRLQVEPELSGDARLSWVHAHGAPVQYRYAADVLGLQVVQNAYAARPWAVEMPSAGRPLTWARLHALRARGVGIARLTHGAGLSATGDPALDQTLPWPERSDLPAETLRAVRATRAAGGRVIAVGTTVVRALEAAAARGWTAGEHEVDLVLDAGHRRRAVDGVLTNMHGPDESHFRLLSAIAPPALLARAHAQAAAAGYRAHELGDVALILGEPMQRPARHP
ncbi:MAG: S-adenosylmethionine:tRNA ribosyltransferase-isomerase [Alphaproteobacteria bacterium]|nr:S-adenosylmethionine:tRNA ribosyltransferase-isomerase [Alphaproteobacteria bacterium]